MRLGFVYKSLEVAFDEAGVNLVFDKKIVREDVQAERYRGLYRLDNKFGKGPFHRGDGFGSRPPSSLLLIFSHR